LTNLDFSSPLIKSAALDLMHPALFGGLGLNKLNISTSLAQFFTRGNPGYCCTDVCLCEDASLWVIPFGQNFHVAGIDQQKGFHSTNLGILGGIDGCVTDYVSLGLSGGFTHSKIKWEMSAGDGAINSYFGALYGDFKVNEGYLNVSARAASNSFHCNRHIYFPSYIQPGSPAQIVDFVATNTHSGVDFGTHIGGGYTIRLNHDEFRITPHAEADYFYMQEGGYSEENASYFNLDVKRRDTSYAKASIGLRLSKPIQLEKGCITPLVDLGWANVMPMQGNFFHANLQGISEPFMVRTFTEYWNLLLVSAELSGTITDYTEVSAGYSLETDGHYTSQQLDVRLGVKF
jgi:outer membrane autotransporter protein